MGNGAIEANDGAAGLEILQSPGRIDLLITDINLRDLNGRKMAETARLLRAGPTILLMTGYAENAGMASGFREPGMEMMTKPFVMNALAGRIRTIIGA